MNRAALQKVVKEIYKECDKALDDGQKEYSHREDDVFGNFRRAGDRLHLDPKKVMLVYLDKHSDGIASYVEGHRSQRENIRGRIKDSIVYNILLWALIDEEENRIPDPPLTPEQEQVIKNLGLGENDVDN
jgi:hypothetical protein